MLFGGWHPRTMTGDRVILRRHVTANLAAFKRWYANPEIARLTRYQEGPMAGADIERFFQERVVGPGSFAMAIHVRKTDQLVGTCAFSQLDADNGSALFHITIGEKSAWGLGYGTEATRLMLRHAFGRLHLHRVGLSVFAFNERAIRSYRKVGFAVEGRAREAIWRDGRYWDELAMGILERDWATGAHGANGADGASDSDEADDGVRASEARWADGNDGADHDDGARLEPADAVRRLPRVSRPG